MKHWSASIILIIILLLFTSCSNFFDDLSAWQSDCGSLPFRKQPFSTWHTAGLIGSENAYGKYLPHKSARPAISQGTMETGRVIHGNHGGVAGGNFVHHFFSKNALRALAIKTYDGSGQAMHPKVLYFKNGWNGWNYWMSYTPYPNTNDKYENPSLAVSQDGVTWTIPKGLRNPVIGSPADVRSGGHNSDPDLVMCGRTMELWYRYNPARRHGGQADSSINRIYMMASVNGTRWTAPRLVLSGGYMYYSPAVLYDSGWKVWFSNDDGKLYFTESADLTTWTNPVAVSLGITGFDIWHQDIIRTCQGYKIIFSAYRKGQFDLDNQRLYYAFSRDGLRFSAPYMILAPSSGADRLDNRMIYRSSILDVNGSSSIYYSAMSRKGEWHIFLTHLNMPKITPVYGS